AVPLGVFHSLESLILACLSPKMSIRDFLSHFYGFPSPEMSIRPKKRMTRSPSFSSFEACEI
ncbi:MAG: hypothetical protein MJY75_08190, partial [Bacteroidaceae bacterium]|nr:hypothetical protein [Bacteroidaceae bacterium]